MTSPNRLFPIPNKNLPDLHLATMDQIDQHLKKLFKKYKGFPIFWNTVYIKNINRP